MKNNNNLKILVVVLIVIILGLGGFIIYDKVLKDNNVENKDSDNKNDNILVDDSKIEIHNDIDYDNCNLDLNDSVNRFVCYNQRLFYYDYPSGIDYKDFLTNYLIFFSTKSDTLLKEEKIDDIKWKRSISKSDSKKLIEKYFGTNLDTFKLDKSDEEFILQGDDDNYFIIGRTMGFDNKFLEFKNYEKIGDYEYKLIFDIIADGYNNFGTKTMKIKLNGNYYQIKEIS